jgi:hypothetical protein
LLNGSPTVYSPAQKISAMSHSLCLSVEKQYRFSAVHRHTITLALLHQVCSVAHVSLHDFRQEEHIVVAKEKIETDFNLVRVALVLSNVRFRSVPPWNFAN